MSTLNKNRPSNRLIFRKERDQQNTNMMKKKPCFSNKNLELLIITISFKLPTLLGI